MMHRSFAVILLLSVSLTLSAFAAPPTSQPAPAAAPPRLLPTCEINRLDLPQYYDAALPGLRAWAQVTDSACVITSRLPDYRADLWQRLARDVPGLSIVPGLKLSGHPSQPIRLDDLAVWQGLAAAVTESVAATGSAFVLLDTESGRYPWLQGEYEVASWPDVLRGMALLPPDVTYLLYPPVGYAVTDPRRAKTERFVRTFLRAHPDAWLVTFQYATRATPHDSYYRSVQALNESLAPGRCLDIAYTYRDASRVNDWQPAHLPRLLAECPRPVLIYGHWGADADYAAQQAAVVALVQQAQQRAAQVAALAGELAVQRAALQLRTRQIDQARAHLDAAHAALAPQTESHDRGDR